MHQYMPTKLMLADILTKPLKGDLFRTMSKELLNRELLKLGVCCGKYISSHE
jgi:hypothetical protein